MVRQRRTKQRPDPGTAHDALRAFGNAVCFPIGEVVATWHFTHRMRQRRFDNLDLVNLAYEGRIFAPPQWDARHQEWKWRVEGLAVDGRPMAVAFTLLGPRRVKAVTIMRRGKTAKP